MNTLEIVIEPVIHKIKPILKKEIFRNSEKSLITETLIKNDISFKITNNSSATVNNLKLRSIEILGSQINYQRTFSENYKTSKIKPKESKITGSFKVLFPVSGLYWLDVIAEPTDGLNYTFLQRTLEGELGNAVTANTAQKCRNPIGVIDNLSSNMDIYTRILLLLTILMAVFTLYDGLSKIF